MDQRTAGKPTWRPGYKGVYIVQDYDVSLRRYLDTLADELMSRAE